MPDEKRVVMLSEQDHWKNHERAVPDKPMSAGARFALLAVIVALIGGGWYGFGKYKEHMGGSKEMTILNLSYYRGSDSISFDVPPRDAGQKNDDDEIGVCRASDGTYFSYIFVPVSNVGASLRKDGKDCTTISFSGRRFFADDEFWHRATVLVPSERDLQIWQEFLRQVRARHDFDIAEEKKKYEPRRVIPDGWGD